VAIGLLIGAPLFPVFGALSDRIGRKKLIMAGLLIAVFTLIPIYRGTQQAAGNNVAAVSSVKYGVTGEIHLTPLTRDESTVSCTRVETSVLPTIREFGPIQSIQTRFS
jgi:hypothetical protein